MFRVQGSSSYGLGVFGSVLFRLLGGGFQALGWHGGVLGLEYMLITQPYICLRLGSQGILLCLRRPCV